MIIKQHHDSSIVTFFEKDRDHFLILFNRASLNCLKFSCIIIETRILHLVSERRMAPCFWLSRVSEILKSLCNDFLPKNVSAILYLMNYEKYGRSTASAQYFLQLAGYLGIPVIAWNADNSGLERVSGCKSSFPFLSYGEKEEEGRGGGRKKYSVALTKLFSNLVYENG